MEDWVGLFPQFSIDAASLHKDLCLPLRQRIVSLLEEEGFAPDLVQAVAAESVATERLLADPMDVRERLDLLNSLRQSQALPALLAVVQRAARLAEKGDLGETDLTASAVVTAERFESPSETAMYEVLGQLEPLAAGRCYRDLADALVQATPVLEAFFDGDNSVMVMADDAELRRNRLNLLGVLRNQAAVLARFDLIQT